MYTYIIAYRWLRCSRTRRSNPAPPSVSCTYLPIYLSVYYITKKNLTNYRIPLAPLLENPAMESSPPSVSAPSPPPPPPEKEMLTFGSSARNPCCQSSCWFEPPCEEGTGLRVNPHPRCPHSLDNSHTPLGSHLNHGGAVAQAQPAPR